MVEEEKQADIPETERRVLIDTNGALLTALTGAEDIADLRNNHLPTVLFCDGEDLSYEVVSKGYDTNVGDNLRNVIDQWLEKHQSQ